jgi:endoglycosylceramidase
MSLAAIYARPIWIDSEDRVIRDEKNRHVIFHGVNVVEKIAPYIPDQNVFDSQASLTDKDILDLKEWGFNFVRLGVMWEAVETAPGVYNETYLDEVDQLITKLGK